MEHLYKFKKGQRIRIMDTMFSRKTNLANAKGVVKKVLLYGVYLVELDSGEDIFIESDELIAEGEDASTENN